MEKPTQDVIFIIARNNHSGSGTRNDQIPPYSGGFRNAGALSRTPPPSENSHTRTPAKKALPPELAPVNRDRTTTIVTMPTHIVAIQSNNLRIDLSFPRNAPNRTAVVS